MATKTVKPPMTAIAILNETVEYYSADTSRRADSSGTYEYKTTDGRKCAVGRCMLKPVLYEGAIGNLETIKGHNPVEDVDKTLKPQYRGHPKAFWVRLQNLHDNSWYWEKDKGLTEAGKDYVESIKEHIKQYKW